MSPASSILPRIAAGCFVVSVALVGLGLVGVQLGAVAPVSGFYLFGLGAVVGGLASFALGAVAAARGRNGEGAGRRLAWVALGGGAVLLASVVMAALPGAGMPPINDITTDLEDPPAFAPAPPGHPNAGRDMAFPADFAPQIRLAYPDLAPVRLAVPAEEAYQRALKAAEDLGWTVTRRDPAAGTFEAEETSALFRFVDDVAVRVRPGEAGGARIDVRSKSRDGRGDLGANARRIRTLVDELGAG